MTTTNKKTNGKTNGKTNKGDADRGVASLAALEVELSAAFPERDGVNAAPLIPLMLDCIVAALHLLILGPPGTAKTTIARVLAEAIRGARFCKRQFHQQMPIDEVIGPIDVKAFGEGRYVRKIAGYATDAEIFVADEIFKANGAILNPLLTLLESREFEQDGITVPAPLWSCFGISNEIPTADDKIGALHDRYIGRTWIPYIEGDRAWGDLINGRLPTVSATVDAADVVALRRRAHGIKLDPIVGGEGDTPGALRKIVRECRARGIDVSDRRAVYAAHLMRARAARTGATIVDASHLDVLKSVFWSQQDQIETCAQIVDAAAPSYLQHAQGIEAVIAEVRNAWTAATRGDAPSGAASTAMVDANQKLTTLTAKRGEPNALHPSGAPEDGEIVKLARTGAKGSAEREKAHEKAAELLAGVGVLSATITRKAAALGLLSVDASAGLLDDEDDQPAA